MAKMKDSGIEWIGEIPEDWNVTKLKYEFDFGKGLPITKDNLIEIGLPVVSYGQIHSKLNNGTSINPVLLRYVKPYYQFTNPQSRVKKGDFIFADTSEDLEGCGNAVLKCDDSDLFAGYHSIIMHSHKPEYAKYFSYLFLTNEWRNQLRSRVYGVKVLSVTQTIFKFTSIILPPPETQKRIADFLDEKCAKIDGLKNDIQKQIEILEQYKKSVITEAVTKGINPNAKMKDSGVEWIGKIPEHWEVSNPKWHFAQRKDRAKLGLKQYTASQKYGVISQEEYMERTGAKIVTVAKDFDILKLVCPGDFVIHMRSFQGGLEYSESYGSISSAYVMLIPQKTIANPRYYRWFFKSPVYIDALSSTSNLIRDGQAMRYANFVQIPILIPTVDEQTDIADYLDKKCSSIEGIISTKKQQLEKLEEYKKSLIFEYVTGKKEVV